MAILKIEFLGILLCLSSLALSQRVPTISYITEEQIRDVGDDVDLECSVQHAQEYPVVWIKSAGKNSTDKMILSSNTALIIRDNRYSVQYHRASRTYTFSMKDVQESDAGLYLCQILISQDNQITAEVDLKVNHAPLVSDNTTLTPEGVGESGTEANQGTGLSNLRTDARIEATLARIENTLSRIEALEGTAGHRSNLKMDARNEATLARIETTLVRIEATLVRIEAGQIESQKQH